MEPSFIREAIAKIEQEKEFKVLYACETGSRAWGFPSPDSDYDVRIIYKHRKDWYLSLSDKKDTIDLMLEDGDLDITGWDIKKSLQLMWKSNGPLLERLQSPIVYFEAEGFLDLCKPYAEQCFAPVASMYHYLNMGKKSFDDVEGQSEVKLKKLFYALRAAFSCKWIMDKGTTPPIVFHTMLNELEISPSIKSRILELIELKSHQHESYVHPMEQELNDFIKTVFDQSGVASLSLKGRKEKQVDLDGLFLQILNQY